MIPDLAQWDVVRVRIRPTDKDLHPAVVVSRTEVCRDPRKSSINILYGSTKRPATSVGATDVVLNGADGLEHTTAFNCDHLFTVTKVSLEARYGSVAFERRRALSRTIHRAFALLS
ncbi:MAG TPA: type II toxin-antitoxin system PemK/MazF family toxin [Lacunisphaera sp.]|nr:type II toxin-antitoxin system PemK/MazF family toxin [Lacunisphaera sp.]